MSVFRAERLPPALSLHALPISAFVASALECLNFEGPYLGVDPRYRGFCTQSAPNPQLARPGLHSGARLQLRLGTAFAALSRFFSRGICAQIMAGIFFYVGGRFLSDVMSTD